MKRVLVVDDDALNCVMAKRALNNTHEVFSVYSGKEALAFLEEEPVDLILMDIEMPEMNGMDTASQIKQREEWAHIPIIFLTANTDPNTEAEYLLWGADDFIVKPFVPIVMTTRVNRVLELYDLRRDLEKQLENRTRQMETATLKSMTDSLTGLHNRSYLESALSDCLARGDGGTLFMIDLDNFKSINDTFGHIIGDKTLQHFAEILKRNSRQEDIVCRLAGDEFVTFYTGLSDQTAAAQKAEKIIRNFAEKMTSLGYGGIVSVSIGITIASEGEDFQSLYNKADTSLYYVKNNGKNSYHFYGERNDITVDTGALVDLEYICNMIQQGLSDQQGAFQLAYGEFKSVYDFISRCVNRKNQEVQIVLFTMEPLTKHPGISIETVMQLWESSLLRTLRAVDTGTRYSNSQYVMTFLDVDLENGRIVADRVIEKFFVVNENLREVIKISYDIRTMEANN